MCGWEEYLCLCADAWFAMSKTIVFFTEAVSCKQSEMDRRQPYNKICMRERLWFLWLWKRGYSMRLIAKHTGRSPTTVRKWVKRLQQDHRLVYKRIKEKTVEPCIEFSAVDMIRYEHSRRALMYKLYLSHYNKGALSSSACCSNCLSSDPLGIYMQGAYILDNMYRICDNTV